MTGLPVVMGADRSPNETFIQGAGAGLRMTVGNLRRALESSPAFKATCLLHAQTFAVQMTYTAIAHGRSKIEERLAH
jgi:hypothetical protein